MVGSRLTCVKKPHPNPLLKGEGIYCKLMRKNAGDGFTLIETLLYVAIIGMVVGAFITFILVISGLRNKFYVINEVRSNKRTMQDIFQHYLRNAKSVTAPVKQSSSDHLDFFPYGSAQEFSFFEKDGQLLLFDGATDTPIIANEVLVSQLNFANMSASGTPDVLRIMDTKDKSRGLILRHDVDESIDFAYTLFQAENNIGIKSTFHILLTSPHWHFTN